MIDKLRVTRVEVFEFKFTTRDWGGDPKVPTGIYNPGTVREARSKGVRIHTDQGVSGAYIGGNDVEYAGIPAFIPNVIGKNPLQREDIYYDAKHALRQHARMGLGVVDCALWDLAGRYYDVPVYELLGGTPRRLPAYASTALGDSQPDGLSSPEAYADFAEQCYELGYRAYKIHGWSDAPIEKHIDLIHAVGKRMAGKMLLMLDPFCAIEKFGDALRLGWACDEYKFFWWEDPYKDGGVSAFAHRKLRQLVKTPLLQTEHIRGLEQHVDFVVAEGTDFVRGDVNYDGGITGVMKICHASEGFGLDCELHGAMAPHQHIMCSVRNMNFLEAGLFHPKVEPSRPPVYLDAPSMDLDAVGADGCFDPPGGPGLGLEIDWDYIKKNQTDRAVYE